MTLRVVVPGADRFTWNAFHVVTPPKKKRRTDLDWDADLHPRDEVGRFVGGGRTAATLAVLKDRYPEVAANYAKDSGTEMGSIEAHTLDVAREWETQLSSAELADISGRFGSDVEKLMATAVPLHDIGKPAALEARDKTQQHAHTVPLLQAVLRQEGFGKKDIALATELINHDLIGPLFRGYSTDTAQQVADKITAKAQKVGMDVADFATLQLAFYQADASAYPYITQYMQQEPSGKWTFAGAKQIAPIEALTKRPLALAWDVPLLLDWNEGDHPRDEHGQWVESGGARVFLAKATADDAARLKALRVPPAWTEVHLSEDLDADLQAIGTDAKGRTQYRYSAAHSEKASAEKFARLKEFHEALPTLRERIRTDLKDTHLSDTERDAAMILHLIDQTGFRPGSDSETGGDKKAYGATTLTAGHVRIDGDKLSFRFPGKHGVINAKTIRDPLLADALSARKAEVGRGPLFPHASDADVRDYLHDRDGDFKIKDFRTWNGTNTALRTIEKMPVPKDDKAYAKAQKVVATKVAAHLGNTPAVAMKSYIDPAVWSKWKADKS